MKEIDSALRCLLVKRGNTLRRALRDVLDVTGLGRI